MLLRDEVRTALYVLLEGTGVQEPADGEFVLDLDHGPTVVRVCEDPRVIMVSSSILDDVASSPALLDRLNDWNSGTPVFRLFWENESVILRGDAPANPFDTMHLQELLAMFDGDDDSLSEEVRSWAT